MLLTTRVPDGDDNSDTHDNDDNDDSDNDDDCSQDVSAKEAGGGCPQRRADLQLQLQQLRGPGDDIDIDDDEEENFNQINSSVHPDGEDGDDHLTVGLAAAGG